jgi:DNA-binding MurR/RpiR family transcriptional regulator
MTWATRFRSDRGGCATYVHISSAAIKRARGVNDPSLEEVANLIEQAPWPVVVAIFAGGEGVFADDARWVHVLRGGDCVAAADDHQQVAVLSFETSAASFVVTQICRRREEEHRKQEKERRKREDLKQRTGRVAMAAE